MGWHLFGSEQRYTFTGAYGHEVELVLYPQHAPAAGHVVILAVYKDQLLFTRHKTRGLEWPGGKVESHETPLQGALRELEEETGGQASSLWLIGCYRVREKNGGSFLKNIYFAEVDQLKPEHTGEDTLGAVLLPVGVQPDDEAGFSPLVTDSVFSLVRQTVFNGNSVLGGSVL